MPKETTTIIIEELTPEELAAEEQAEAVTLADMPDRVHCIDTRGSEVFRIGNSGYFAAIVADLSMPWRCVRPTQDVLVACRIDGMPLPTKTKPLPKTLADAAEGRVYEVATDAYNTFNAARIGGRIWQIAGMDGACVLRWRLDTLTIVSRLPYRITMTKGCA